MFTRQNNDWDMREVEAFFGRLQGQVIRRDVEDVMIWWMSKEDIFTIKPFYSSLAICRLIRHCVEPLGPNEGSPFCLRSFMGKNSNYGLAKKKGLVFIELVLFV